MTTTVHNVTFDIFYHPNEKLIALSVDNEDALVLNGFICEVEVHSVLNPEPNKHRPRFYITGQAKKIRIKDKFAYIS